MSPKKLQLDQRSAEDGMSISLHGLPSSEFVET